MSDERDQTIAARRKMNGRRPLTEFERGVIVGSDEARTAVEAAEERLRRAEWALTVMEYRIARAIRVLNGEDDW